MASQLDHLKKPLARLEALPDYSPDNPFVLGLKAQIARYEKPRADNPVEMYSAGMRSPDPKQEN